MDRNVVVNWSDSTTAYEAAMYVMTRDTSGFWKGTLLLEALLRICEVASGRKYIRGLISRYLIKWSIVYQYVPNPQCTILRWVRPRENVS